MADFPADLSWLRSFTQGSPNVQDRRTFLNEGTARDFYDLVGFAYPNGPKGGGEAVSREIIPPYQGNQLQMGLGLPDLLRYRPDAVSPVVLSLRDAERIPQRVPLPRKRPSGGK